MLWVGVDLPLRIRWHTKREARDMVTVVAPKMAALQGHNHPQLFSKTLENFARRGMWPQLLRVSTGNKKVGLLGSNLSQPRHVCKRTDVYSLARSCAQCVVRLSSGGSDRGRKALRVIACSNHAAPAVLEVKLKRRSACAHSFLRSGLPPAKGLRLVFRSCLRCCVSRKPITF